MGLRSWIRCLHLRSGSRSSIDSSPAPFVRAVALRAATLSTETCRGLCGRPESLAHILGKCALSHPARVRRHNAVLSMLANKLTRTGATVTVEPTVSFSPTFLKPAYPRSAAEAAQLTSCNALNDNVRIITGCLRVETSSIKAYPQTERWN